MKSEMAFTLLWKKIELREMHLAKIMSWEQNWKLRVEIEHEIEESGHN